MHVEQYKRKSNPKKLNKNQKNQKNIWEKREMAEMENKN